MNRSSTLLRKGVFPLAMVLSLGFGASQVLAAPQEPAATQRACSYVQCNANCQSWGYDYGVCQEAWCWCYYW